MASLWTAFAAKAASQVEAPALMFSEDIVSFGQLKTAAERCAAALVANGVRRGDVVALRMPKRQVSYALLLACLRQGAPYVFLDPKNPPERAARMIERLRPKLLISETATLNPFGGALTIDRDSADNWIAEFDVLPCDTAAAPTGSDPAYIMFTSGSTGEPKGAVIPHQGVLSLMAWARRMGYGAPGECFTGINPLHFDNSVFDIYCGLFNGAALLPIETSEVSNPSRWVKAIREGGASVMFAVPTLFLILDQLGLLTTEKLPNIRTFQFGGEGFPIGKLREFYARFEGRARLINVYGPTETSCICSSIEITPEILGASDAEFPPLGRMHDDFTYAVFGEDNTQRRTGQPGELWISGPCVGLGYYANPQETAVRFGQDPRQQAYRAIGYRTGDLVREDAQGRLWFHGRVDNQVKIRGHRIELEEIDLAVQSVPYVRRAVAVVLAGEDGSEIAVAYMADRAVVVAEVIALCREKLPAYMLPTKVVQFDDLPRNANGKIDRKAARLLLERMKHS